jgi:hypothetical protein
LIFHLGFVIDVYSSNIDRNMCAKMNLLIPKITILVNGLLLLAACSQSPPTNYVSSPSSSAPLAVTSPVADQPKAESNKGTKNKGGQVVESGKYHLELVSEKGASSTHLDLYVQKGDTDAHDAIANAQVTAEVQSPDGQQKTVPFSYDAGGKHYAAEMFDKSSGQYQVKVTAKIGSDQADGRFSFSR